MAKRIEPGDPRSLSKPELTAIIKATVFDYFCPAIKRDGKEFIGCSELRLDGNNLFSGGRVVDLLFLSSKGIAVEVEVKSHWSDFKQNGSKRFHSHEDIYSMDPRVVREIPHFRYFAVPRHVYESHDVEIQEECTRIKWGLIVVNIRRSFSDYTTISDCTIVLKPKFLIDKTESRENLRWTILRRMSRQIRSNWAVSAKKILRKLEKGIDN
jgi:hypothetical protein